MRLFLLLTLLFAPATSPTPDQCDAIHTLVGGELVAWQGYPTGWNLPSDLKKTARIDFADGGIWERHSDSEQARYIVVFLSYTVDGTPAGAHDFCGPYKVSDHD